MSAILFFLLKMICNDFLPNWLKVVSSCLLQYKPVCVTNFDKLCRKMVKSTSLLVFLVLLYFGYFRHVWRHTWICLFCLRCCALLGLVKLFILPVYVSVQRMLLVCVCQCVDDGGMERVADVAVRRWSLCWRQDKSCTSSSLTSSSPTTLHCRTSSVRWWCDRYTVIIACVVINDVAFYRLITLPQSLLSGLSWLSCGLCPVSPNPVSPNPNSLNPNSRKPVSFT